MPNHAPISQSLIKPYLPMVNDGWRNRFYYEALKKHAQDKVVIDVGTGTGILAYYALLWGAKFVYCIDLNPASAQMADRLLSGKFDRSRFRVINEDFWSDKIVDKIDRPIDILLSETVGPGLFDCGMFHTWQRIQKFLSPNAISIPDRLHFDVWVWNDRVNYDSFYQQGQSVLEIDETLDQDYANLLLEIDQDLSSGIPMNWSDINQITSEPVTKYTDVLSYTMQDHPQKGFSDEIHYNECHPTVTFELELPRNCTVGIINKMSFEDDTLYIKDAKYMPWKWNPVFYLPESGKYKFTWSNFYIQFFSTREWTCEAVV